MRMTVAVEQRKVSDRPPLQTWQVAYQEMPLVRAGWKPPTAGHIPGPIKQLKQEKEKASYGKSHHPTVYASKAEKQKAIARRALDKQKEKLKLVTSKHKQFSRTHVSAVLKIDEMAAKSVIHAWKKKNLIRATGDMDNLRCYIWEAGK